MLSKYSNVAYILNLIDLNDKIKFGMIEKSFFQDRSSYGNSYLSNGMINIDIIWMGSKFLPKDIN